MSEKTKVRIKKFTFFVGIDVSKNELDYAVMMGKKLLFHREGKNTPDEIFLFIGELKKLPGFTIPKTLFCMEHTGYYCNHLIGFFKKLKANLSVQDALHIKRSLGTIRGKDDKTDAIRIATFAHKNRDDIKIWQPRRPELAALVNALSIRNRLLGTSVALTNMLKEEFDFIPKDLQKVNANLFAKTISAVKDDLVEAELLIDKLINGDKLFQKLLGYITSVPGVGQITAIQMIICTNEFRDIKSAKKFACYAGVAPYKRESGGTMRRSKISQIGNRRMKSLLHLCALNAVRCDAELKGYYLRKTKSDGKPKLAVLNAVRNKLLLRVFSCVKNERAFEKEHPKPNDITAGELAKSQDFQV